MVYKHKQYIRFFRKNRLIVDSLRSTYIYGTYCDKTYTTWCSEYIYNKYHIASIQLNNLYTKKQINRLNSWLHYMERYEMDCNRKNITIRLVDPNIRLLNNHLSCYHNMEIEYIVSNIVQYNPLDMNRFRNKHRVIVL
jgi:hypothetical protein